MAKQFGFIGHDFMDLDWTQARGYLREELEQLRAVLNRSRVNLGNTLDIEGRLDYNNLPEADNAPSVIGARVDGDFREIRLGPGLVINGDTISVSPSELTNALQLIPIEESFTPYPLVPTFQTTSSSSSTTSSQTSPTLPLELQEDREFPWPQQPYFGNNPNPNVKLVSWVPLSLGVEPLQFVSDGAGSPIFVTFSA